MRPSIVFGCVSVICAMNTVLVAEPPRDFTVQSPTHGTSFSLADAKGKIVALHFLLKTECPYCLRHTKSYAAQALNRKDIVHVFLKPDADEEIKRWASKIDAKDLKDVPAIYRDADAKLAKAFNIPDGYKFHGQSVHYPALVVLDENGNELFRYVGKSNSDRLSYPDFEKRLSEARSASSDLVPRRLMLLIHANEVQQELKLSEDQVKELEACFARLDGRWFRSRIMPAEKQASELKAVEAEFWSWAPTVLKAEQIKRLKQLELQATGSRMFLRDDVARYLKFTKSQSEKLMDMVRTTETARSNLQAAESKRQKSQDLEKALMEATNAEQRGIVELLSDAQKQQLSQLIGPSFDTMKLKRIYPMAPEFAAGTEWFNSQPLTLESLRGKVVLVHFYAFQCHNCHANFAIYQRWHKQLKDKGVVVIGIQSPETSQERDPEAVRKAAADRGLEFPIIMDTEMKNWNAWANTMWPTVYVVDKRGYLRHWWQGELNWQGATGDQTIEKVVESALAE